MYTAIRPLIFTRLASDADLLYIIQHLRRETTSIFCILQHMTANGELTVLGRTQQHPTDQPLNPQVPKRDSRLVTSSWQANDDVPDIRRSVWTDESTVLQPAIYCMLHLVFAPTQCDQLVATVCRSKRGMPYSASEEFAAATFYPIMARYLRMWWLHRCAG
jgi:hypothetical protein